MFPIRPGERNYLSGNMGEIRSGHFHGGLDIKTFGRLGLPIYAAADGYVKKIAVSSYGYGNVIHLQHPNGLITIYAHLERFNWSVGNFIRKKQYEQQVFDIEHRFNPNQFPVKKGDIIAWSGNSGSSGGPHLHYEIRDGEDKILNPLYFDCKEIVDRTAPLISKFALICMDEKGKIDGEFGRKEFDMPKKGNLYPQVILVNGSIGVEIATYDKTDGSPHLKGVSHIKVKVDNQPIFGHSINFIEAIHQKNVSLHINTEVALAKGRNFQKCYLTDGNTLPFYETINGGRIVLKDTLKHKITIQAADAYMNQTEFVFYIQKSEYAKNFVSYVKKVEPTIKEELFENTLKISISPLETSNKNNDLCIYAKGKTYLGTNFYYNNHQKVFLYDMRKALPDSIKFGTQKLITNYVAMVIPNRNFIYKTSNLNITIPKGALPDTLYLKVSLEGGEIRLAPEKSLLLNDIEVQCKLDSTPQNKDKIMVIGGKKRKAYKTEWNSKNEFTFKTNQFGKYGLILDTISPVIIPIHNNKDLLSFMIKDFPAGIQCFKAKVNNEWVLMNYDHKKSLIKSEKWDPDKLFEGEVVLEVEDLLKNKSIHTFTINGIKK